ncbi:glycosyltransferase [Galbibacter pacificus]|uniref:Glycosyltransferase n=1 Tax=Galbibacter pacificus TaxID=2996052 RepID=A0ABT6FWE5_9FLAO|nr:glycosyltransferase [Galbibacter pacificus]MDG3583975.1 glycosyltransferase [Galbibacter pacificus]MDG3587588.1 glycosyltransferase [Galbibacter pacificus]
MIKSRQPKGEPNRKGISGKQKSAIQIDNEISPARKKILVAPLNWGLGHATRCIPIIKSLLENNFEPIIASDGDALNLLKKEFPALTFVEMPSYKIKYSEKAKYFKLKMLWDSPKILKAMKKEHQQTKHLVKAYNLCGIISDNRLGVYSKKVPCVFITHQLNVLTGNTTWVSSKVHQKIIDRYNQCWVPDVEGEPNLSGKLGHLQCKNEKIKYIGALSRLEKKDTAKKYRLMVIISGPEPQRTLLEKHLLVETERFSGAVLFIKGKIEKEQQVTQQKNTTIYNYMNSAQLENAFNESELVLSRSGYTTVLDLAKLGKRAFFIPTPGQYEQEYLAERLQQENLVPYCNQDEFAIEMLERTKNYKGLSEIASNFDISGFLSLFEGK